MGLFFSSSKKLSEKEIDQALADSGVLEGRDKQYIKKLLKSRRAGGVTKRDVIDITRRLKNDTTDSVDRTEAEAARRQLLEELED